MSAALQPLVPQITQLSDLPDYVRLLTGPGGALELSPADRQWVVLLEVASGHAAAVFQGGDRAAQVMQSLAVRAQANAVAIDSRHRAPAELIATIYSTAIEVAAVDRSPVALAPQASDKLLDDMLTLAWQAQCSDVHLRVSRDAPALVLQRRFGDLEIQRRLAPEVAERLSHAIYVKCEESSKPGNFNADRAHEARLVRTIAGVRVTYRYQLIPTHDGWDIVLRRLTTAADRPRSLDQLGFDRPVIDALTEAIAQPDGLVLLSGATGSGKTTTIASLLALYVQTHGGARLARSIEDPVEIYVPGVRHSPALGGGPDDDPFAAMLKCHLRGDPDLEMVGEVRDRAAATTLVSMVQSGHVSVTTVHARNPVDALGRLINLGADPAIVCSAGFVLVVMTQKLVKRLCRECCVDIDQVSLPTGLQRQLLEIPGGVERGALRFQGEGCEQCHQGVVGVIPCPEILLPDRGILRYLAADNLDAAYAYWRAGMTQQGPTAGRTKLDVGIRAMAAGQLDPRHLVAALGHLGRQETPAEAKASLRPVAAGGRR